MISDSHRRKSNSCKSNPDNSCKSNPQITKDQLKPYPVCLIEFVYSSWQINYETKCILYIVSILADTTAIYFAVLCLFSPRLLLAKKVTHTPDVCASPEMLMNSFSSTSAPSKCISHLNLTAHLQSVSAIKYKCHY